jgi:hypothetical protein
MMILARREVPIAALVALGLAARLGAETPPPATPSEMVATYQSLADTILGAKRTEENLVRSVLAATYAHAQSELARARAALKAGDTAAARAAIENLAAAVGQIGTEGDNAVAAVRKRLLEGGHHHNAAGESQGVFDEGYVIVTKVAKRSLLEASRALGRLAREPKAETLEAEWKNVEIAWTQNLAAHP